MNSLCPTRGWEEIADMDWDDLRHFAAFMSGGSLSAAARQLGVEHATVARRLVALERRLDLKLVDRRGRRLVLTPDGERVAAVVERMTGDLQAIERLASGARSELTGTVTISAPPAYAAAVIAPKLVPLRRRHPGLSVRILGETRLAALERREADVAIRLSRPEAGDLTATRIGHMPFRLYAHPDYLAATPEGERTFIGSEGPMAHSPQQAALAKIAAGTTFGFHADQAEIQLALAAAGGGIAILPDFMAAGRIDLVALRPGESPLLREVWMVVHSDLRAAAPIRAVVECLRRTDALRSLPAEGTSGDA